MESKFEIAPSGTGFAMTFQNGWTVSVQFGVMNYGSNRHKKITESPNYTNTDDPWGSRTAEIAAWNGDEWYAFGEDTVQGYCTTNAVAAFIHKVEAFPARQLAK